MRARARLADLGIDYKTKQTKATFLIECGPDVLEAMAEDDLLITAKKYSPKKTLDQNGYLWILLQGITDKLRDGSTRWSNYLRCLQEYGVFCYLPAQGHDIKMLEAVFRLVVDRGEITITTPSGKQVQVRQMQCFKGTSLYSKQEMSTFLDHVVEEAKSLGVDTLTPDEYEHLKGLA